MDVDTGISRKLPEKQPEDMPDPPKLKEKNVFVVTVNRNDDILVEGETFMTIDQIAKKLSSLLTMVADLGTLSMEQNLRSATGVREQKILHHLTTLTKRLFLWKVTEELLMEPIYLFRMNWLVPIRYLETDYLKRCTVYPIHNC